MEGKLHIEMTTDKKKFMFYIRLASRQKISYPERFP